MKIENTPNRVIAKINGDDSFDIKGKYKNVADTGDNVLLLLKNNYRHVMLRGKVKAGKRKVAQYIAVTFLGLRGKSVIHYLITKLNRLDCKDQINEHNNNHLIACDISDSKNAENISLKIQNEILKGKHVVVHIDESDYGTAYSQCLNIIYSSLSECDNVQFIYYSATNQELSFSELSTRKDFASVDLIVSDNYRGAEFLYKNDCFRESEPFFIKNKEGIFLSKQGSGIIGNFIESDKNILVIRVSGGSKKVLKKKMVSATFNDIKNYEGFDTLCKGIEIVHKFIGENNKFEWGNGPDNDWENYMNRGIKLCIIICQTSTRSTEWGFHKHLFAYHDHRNNSTLTTNLQSTLRVCHHHEIGHTPLVYGCVDSMKVAAGIISEQEYLQLKPKRKISNRVGAIKTKKNDISSLIFDTEEEAKIAVKSLLVSRGECENPHISTNTCSKWLQSDLILSTINGVREGFSINKGAYRIYHLDSASESFEDSWEMLVNEYPQYVGKFIFIDIVLSETNIEIYSKHTMYR